MTTADGAFYERAYVRLSRFMVAFSVLGTLAVWYRFGLAAGAGFLVGAAVSMVNFRWLKQLAEAIGSKGPPRKLWRAVVFGGRYLLFGLACYVIVKVFGINVLAILAGLLVAAAAVLSEIIFELIYARA
jgi:hypothetical protein